MHQPLLPPPTSTHLKQDKRALSVEAKFEAVLPPARIRLAGFVSHRQALLRGFLSACLGSASCNLRTSTACRFRYEEFTLAEAAIPAASGMAALGAADCHQRREALGRLVQLPWP